MPASTSLPPKIGSDRCGSVGSTGGWPFHEMFRSFRDNDEVPYTLNDAAEPSNVTLLGALGRV